MLIAAAFDSADHSNDGRHNKDILVQYDGSSEMARLHALAWHIYYLFMAQAASRSPRKHFFVIHDWFTVLICLTHLAHDWFTILICLTHLAHDWFTVLICLTHLAHVDTATEPIRILQKIPATELQRVT